MSKRRISDQQSHRIHQKQTRLQDDAQSNTTTLTDGLVITRYSRLALVETSEGRQFRCSIRPGITSVVAGDRVVWQPEGHQQGVIVSVYPRQSVLSRTDYRGIGKAIAANITQILIVVAPIPKISWSLLDSYLVMVEVLNLNACIVCNKTDLPCAELKQQLTARYEPLGYTLCFTHRAIKPQQDPLTDRLKQETSVFVGQSGVGKSSIIAKRLSPQESESIQTGGVSAHSNLGCHTTSNSCLYHLSEGGQLIDSPGVREFNLWDMPQRQIAQGFREFRQHLNRCQFRNCNHIDAPGCALLDALRQDLIDESRYQSYVKLVKKQFDG